MNEYKFWKVSAASAMIVTIGLLALVVMLERDLVGHRTSEAVLNALLNVNCTSRAVGEVAVIMVVGEELGCVRGVYTPSKATLQQYMQRPAR